MKAKNVQISVIVPIYNGENYLNLFLKSISKLANLKDIEVLLIDNNSKDSSIKIIKHYEELIKITLIQKKVNLGFAKACNLGVAKSNGKYIFITNQDVVFPKDFFVILLEIYDKLSSKASIILSPAVVYKNKKINYFGGKIHFSGISYTPMMGTILPEKKITFKTMKFSGCSCFMLKKIFDNLNGFDSNFFMYKEDVDMSLRALRNGISIYTTNETILFHLKDHSHINDFIYFYIERNRFIMIYKNVENLKKLIPFLISIEIVLIFQSILENKFKIRLKIYKYFFENYKILKFQYNNNNLPKIKKEQLNLKLDPIILGKFRKVSILKVFLKIFNFFLT